MKNFLAASAVIVGIFGCALFGIVMASDDGATSYRTPDRSDACFIAQKFVKQNLKAPTTAEFPYWGETDCTATQNGNIWKVRSYVDAQNGFGAMIRSDYGVEMRYNPGKDNWTLLDIMIVNR